MHVLFWTGAREVQIVAVLQNVLRKDQQSISTNSSTSPHEKIRNSSYGIKWSYNSRPALCPSQRVYQDCSSSQTLVVCLRSWLLLNDFMPFSVIINCNTGKMLALNWKFIFIIVLKAFFAKYQMTASVLQMILTTLSMNHLLFPISLLEISNFYTSKNVVKTD